jgi:hypothetical protein
MDKDKDKEEPMEEEADLFRNQGNESCLTKSLLILCKNKMWIHLLLWDR